MKTLAALEKLLVIIAAVAAMFPISQYYLETRDREMERVALATLAMSQCREAFDFRMAQSTAAAENAADRAALARPGGLSEAGRLQMRAEFCQSLDALALEVLDDHVDPALIRRALRREP